MNFVKHLDLEGLHAPFSASQPFWLRYDDEKIITSYRNKKSAQLGSALHEWAKQTIDLRIKQPRSKKTLYSYVNDAIGFRMSTEVVLFYSPYFFGTADTICFRNNVLRIHDLKTGVSKVHVEQLRVYAALFCLEYRVDPREIDIILRIYQNDDFQEEIADSNEIKAIMEKIIHSDKLIQEIEAEV